MSYYNDYVTVYSQGKYRISYILYNDFIAIYISNSDLNKVRRYINDYIIHEYKCTPRGKVWWSFKTWKHWTIHTAIINATKRVKKLNRIDERNKIEKERTRKELKEMEEELEEYRNIHSIVHQLETEMS